jgi:hypothetical protein
MAGFFQRLSDKIFGKAPAPKQELPRSEAGISKKPTSLPGRKEPESSDYFVQIGLDFGTAFTKAICRDIITSDKVWVYIPHEVADSDLPFLISSALLFEKGVFRHDATASRGYSTNGLPHVKMALEKIGLGRWDDPVLAPFMKASGADSEKALAAFVEASAIYLLAGVIGGITADIPNHFPKAFKKGRVAINMAVPVANANHPEVDAVFKKVLQYAWVLAEPLNGFPPVSWTKMQEMITTAQARTVNAETVDECSTYPEVSANVQAFVRSRTSSEGIYLFSDAGAGTVDQSVFLFSRNGGTDKLTYLHAEVLPLGSSQLERRAAQHAKKEGWKAFEKWREKKENGQFDIHLNDAKRTIKQELKNGSEITIWQSREKLPSVGQINELRVLFGGGGHIEDPYGVAVMDQFKGRYFREERIKTRENSGPPFDVGMPEPQDLKLKSTQRGWMKRLTVAYGLSFEKSELAIFKLPKDVQKPEDVWRPVGKKVEAPSKDEC